MIDQDRANCLALDICKVLGIEPTYITNVRMEFSCHSLSKVYIERLVGVGDIQEIKTIIERYQLKAEEVVDA